MAVLAALHLLLLTHLASAAPFQTPLQAPIQTPSLSTPHPSRLPVPSSPSPLPLILALPLSPPPPRLYDDGGASHREERDDKAKRQHRDASRSMRGDDDDDDDDDRRDGRREDRRGVCARPFVMAISVSLGVFFVVCAAFSIFLRTPRTPGADTSQGDYGDGKGGAGLGLEVIDTFPVVVFASPTQKRQSQPPREQVNLRCSLLPLIRPLKAAGCTRCGVSCTRPDEPTFCGLPFLSLVKVRDDQGAKIGETGTDGVADGVGKLCMLPHHCWQGSSPPVAHILVEATSSQHLGDHDTSAPSDDASAYDHDRPACDHNTSSVHCTSACGCAHDRSACDDVMSAASYSVSPHDPPQVRHQKDIEKLQSHNSQDPKTLDLHSASRESTLHCGCRKLAAAAAATFPLFNHHNSLSECAVCLSDFAAGEFIRCLPQCGHRFHVTCIDLWLANQTTCPTCRTCLKPKLRPEAAVDANTKAGPENNV